MVMSISLRGKRLAHTAKCIEEDHRPRDHEVGHVEDVEVHLEVAPEPHHVRREQHGHIDRHRHENVQPQVGEEEGPRGQLWERHQ